MKHLLLFGWLLLAGSVYSQDFALNILESSPRHHEWVNVQAGDRTVRCFVAYPEVAEKATVVIVIHENRGLTDWVRAFTDALAEQGYLAIAPDLLSDFSEDYRLTTEFPTSDDARNAIYQLPAEQVTADLNAVQAYATALPASNGKNAVVGFCWGGAQSFLMATNNSQLSAAMVFYGSPPSDSAAWARVQVPVYGFYGETDARINATIPDTQAAMEAAGKQYDPVIYPTVGHAYMRRGHDPASEAEYQDAYRQSMERLIGILSRL